MLAGSALWALIRGPFGKVVAVVAAFAIWTAYQRHDATQACEARQEAAQLEEQNRLLREADRIARESRERASRAEQSLRAVEAERDQILAELAAKGASCPIPPDLARRLHAIQ